MAAADSAECWIGVIVRDHAFSLGILCRRRPLRHPKGYAYSRICLPFFGCSHKGIHQICELLSPKHCGQEKNDESGSKNTDIHLFSFGVLRTIAPCTNVAAQALAVNVPNGSVPPPDRNNMRDNGLCLGVTIPLRRARICPAKEG